METPNNASILAPSTICPLCGEEAASDTRNRIKYHLTSKGDTCLIGSAVETGSGCPICKTSTGKTISAAGPELAMDTFLDGTGKRHCHSLISAAETIRCNNGHIYTQRNNVCWCGWN